MIQPASENFSGSATGQPSSPSTNVCSATLLTPTAPICASPRAALTRRLESVEGAKKSRANTFAWRARPKEIFRFANRRVRPRRARPPWFGRNAIPSRFCATASSVFPCSPCPIARRPRRRRPSGFSYYGCDSSSASPKRLRDEIAS